MWCIYLKQVFHKNIVLFSLGSLALVSASTVIYCMIDREYTWASMMWNFFLAVLPLYFALLTQYFYTKKKQGLTALCFVAWFFFFPNSPYLMTDIKYIAGTGNELWLRTDMGRNINKWFLLTNIAISVFLGLLIGMISLYIIHKLVKEKWGGIAGWCLVVIVSAASSFGVYLGRFPRLNSWDVLRPWLLFEQVVSSINEFSLAFTGIFFIATLFVYLGVYWLFRCKDGLS